MQHDLLKFSGFDCSAISFLRSGYIAAFFFVTASAVCAEPQRVRLEGDFGYTPQALRKLPPGATVDATGALFHMSNSGTSSPTVEMPCDVGDLPINRYPLQIRNSQGVKFNGGLFAGEVPLESDWESTYCNSAAMALRDSPGSVLEDLRMRRVWDAVRVSEGSGGFVIRGSWISEVRDDCIENDFLSHGMIEDTLLDGCFSGISMRAPKGEERHPADGSLILRGVLMRMHTYLYKGRYLQGPPLKVAKAAPKIEIYDSIIAMNDSDIVSASRLSIGWAGVGTCNGNLMLWTADTPWPDGFERPPSCFRIVEGAEARNIWAQARRNWVDCHPRINRFEDDPQSNTATCDVSEFGGIFGVRR